MTITTPSAFQRVFEHILSKADHLAARNTYPIREWIAAGYDVDQDIIPAIDESCKYGARSIYSLAYFSNRIKNRHEKRIKEAHKPKEHTQEEKDAIRAKNIRWHKERGLNTLQCGPQDYAWLEQYERKHGQITA